MSVSPDTKTQTVVIIRTKYRTIDYSSHTYSVDSCLEHVEDSLFPHHQDNLFNPCGEELDV